MEPLAENYQLKWHSYTSFIHTSVASSLFNENFADVALYTTDGRYVMAHRLVLSSCSQYFNQLLKLAPKIPTSLPFVIVLPSEINFKTLKILLQYMYSGESTVSKEILNQVLRGGDILKIMGLWRPREEENIKKNGRARANTPDVNFNSSCSESQKTSDSLQTDNKNGKIEKPQKNQPQEQSTIRKQKDATSNAEKTSSVIVINKERKKTESKTDESKENSINSPISSLDEPTQYLVIKEEPLEWTEVPESEMEIINSKDVFNSEITIKPEDREEDSSENDNLYTPLTCELCSETFTVPAEWVRHVQTHTDMLPAKRQRRGRPAPDEENAPFPPLHCDMCQQDFPTPAEWVHHIQDSHTEFELHWANLEKSGIHPSKSVKPAKQYAIQKYCSICAKKFPSHASMLIHKRTHTGERPYMCEYCMKGFNVKSNLLRHLRTLHDKIIHPTEIEGSSKEEEN